MKCRSNIATFVVGLFLLMLAPCAAEAATYYVATNGNDSNNGSQAAPFRTIAHAVSKMVAGDTTYVRGGIYNEKRILFSKSGTATAPIRLLNAPGEFPVVNFGVNPALPSGERPVYRLELYAGARIPIGWIVIEGLELGYGYDGIKMYNAHDVIIRRNWIHHASSQGILGNGKNILIDRNVISSNGNFISCAQNFRRCNQTHGIYTTGTNWVITNNLIYDSVAWGIHVAGYPWCADGNCYGGGARTKTDPSYAGASGWLIANNTIAYNNNRAGVILWQPATTNIKIINNIFYENSQKLATGNAQGVDFLNSGGGHVIQDNICYATAPGGTACIASSGAGKYTGSNNVTVNPDFQGAGATLSGVPNFGLKPGSPAIDKGQTLSYVVEDHDGNARPAGAGYDIGAYEGGSIPRICSIVGTAVAVPTSVIDPATGRPPTRPGYVLLGVVPPGFTLSAGTLDQSVSGGSVYRLTLAQLSGLTLTPPADFKGTVKIEAFFVPQ